MAELQQSVVTDQDTRHQIQTQILQWEENLERLHCEQFRLRCYMASLQGGELPNPKVRWIHSIRFTVYSLIRIQLYIHICMATEFQSNFNQISSGNTSGQTTDKFHASHNFRPIETDGNILGGIFRGQFCMS